MAAVPILYTFRRCPYAIRARMALRCAGIEVRQREVALRDKPACLLAISPKATVPVLQLPNGDVIDQSLDIMTWALRQADPGGWLAAGDADEAMRFGRPQTDPGLARRHVKQPGELLRRGQRDLASVAVDDAGQDRPRAFQP